MNTRIKTETAANEGGTVWRDRKTKLERCITQKCKVRSNDWSSHKWEVTFTEFKSHDGMPAAGTTLYTRKMTQMSNGPTGLNTRIKT